MIFIQEMNIRGWMCFRDPQRLKLGPKIYSITACTTQNPDRSNWTGKSALADVINFALTGQHRFDTEDEFITHDEPTAEVVLSFSDGSEIKRSRNRGKPTRLWFTRDDGQESYGKEAQLAIYQWLGMTKADLPVTCLFKQGQMARLINASSGDRSEIIAAWLDLKLLEEATAEVRSEISGLLSALKKAQTTETVLASTVADEEIDYEKQIYELQDKLTAAKAKRDKAHTKYHNALKLAADQSRVVEYEQIVVAGKKARVAFDTIQEELGDKEDSKAEQLARDAAKEELGVLTAQRKALVVVADGKFDGKCPVSSIKCPVTKQINSNAKSALAKLRAADVSVAEAQRKWRAASDECDRVQKLLSDAAKLSDALETLRANAKKLQEFANVDVQDVDVYAIRAELKEYEDKVLALTVSINGLQIKLKNEQANRQNLLAIREKIATITAELTVTTELQKIFGRDGVQKKLAEDSLAEIEQIANEILADSDISLQVTVRWSREGKDYATACDVCGWPYPSSVKIKECMQCAAPRGANVINSLEFLISNRSGAADDLAGCAIQLSASRWLRLKRDSGWGVAVMDEPTAQIDKAHRRSWLSSINKMLSSAGFKQAFIISHAADVAEALPGKIQITSDGKHSTIKVKA